MNAATVVPILGTLVLLAMGCERIDWNDGDFIVLTNEMHLASSEDGVRDDGPHSQTKDMFYFVRKSATGDTMTGCCIWADGSERVKIVYEMGAKQVLKGRAAVKWWYDADMEWFKDRNEWMTRMSKKGH